HPRTLRDNSSNSSSTEVGVLVAITGHPTYVPQTRLLLYEVRTITGGGNSTPTIIVPPGEVRPCLHIRRLLTHELPVITRIPPPCLIIWVYMKNRPTRQNIGHCGPGMTASITSGSCDDPRFTWVRPVFGDGP
ncbi:hypothetical protein AVEN_263791-1, partial [Araneus ventricosus]